MHSDSPDLEAALRELQAAPLDEALLARLEAATQGNLTELNRDELRLENLLRKSTPARLSPEYLAELETVFRNVPFPVNDKIVLFPRSGVTPHRAANRPMWAAAAAVALVGAASALLLPPTKPSANSPATSLTSAANPKVAAGNFVPASFNRGVSNVSEEGVVWKSNTQPHSLMRVEYIDRITMKDENGRTFQAEQPRVRYLMVPAKTD